MKKISKILFSLIVIFSITFSTVCTPVYAEWQQSNGKWTYTNSDGSLKTGWFQEGANRYYFNKKGIMITGWVTENNTWYYMREDGSLNNSKTTTTIPNEIQSIFNIVNPFAGGLKLEYAGKGYVTNTDGFSSYGLANKWIVILKSEDKDGNSADFYYVYDPYNCKVFKLYDDLTIKYLGQGNQTNIINEDQAIQNVKNYLTENNISVPSKLVIEQDENNTYKVHCYDDMGDHTATVGWYYVDKSTGNVIKL